MKPIVQQLVNLLMVCLLFIASIDAVHGQGHSAHRRVNSNAKQRSHSQRPHSGQQRHRPQKRQGVRLASAPRYSHDHLLAPGASELTLDPIPVADMVPSESYTQDHYMGDSSGCDSCGMQYQCCCNPAGFLFDWSRADLWLGVTSFNGEGGFLTTGNGTDGQLDGNFGFQEGFNFGSRLPSLLGGQVGAQVGTRFTHTQLDGTSVGPDSRTQTFLTAGLFRRVDYGFQGGLVLDYLHDDWVYKADLLQLRGELSFLFSPCHDFGFRFTDNQQTDNTTATLSSRSVPVAVELSSLNTYRFFYRYRFGECGRGLAELQAGFTEDSGTVLGVDLKTPLQNQLGLEASATYLIPPAAVSNAFVREGWNISLAIVWTPARMFGTQRDYYRPLMNVADNGSLLSRLTQ